MNKFTGAVIRIGVVLASFLVVPMAFPDAKSDSVDWWYDNLRWTVDLSSRVTWFESLDEVSPENVVGLDLHKVFSSSGRDWGTMILQLYLTRIDNHPSPPPFIEGSDDWELVPRIANFNFTGFGSSKFGIRIGHFEIPFGLEVPIDSNGTLRQLPTAREFGTKVDWGAGINGVLLSHELEYEVTLSRGSGVEYFDRDNPFIAAGRIATRDGRFPTFGLSALHGEVAGRAGTSTRRTRVGLDAQSFLGVFGMLAQLSAGEDDDMHVANGYVEVNRCNSTETLLAYCQATVFTQDREDGWVDASYLAPGIRYKPDSHWNLSGQFERTITEFSGKNEASVLRVQARYRF